MPKSTPELAEMTTGPAGPNESHVLYNQSIQQVKNKQLYIFVGKADFRCNHLLPPHNKKSSSLLSLGRDECSRPFFSVLPALPQQRNLPFRIVPHTKIAMPDGETSTPRTELFTQSVRISTSYRQSAQKIKNSVQSVESHVYDGAGPVCCSPAGNTPGGTWGSGSRHGIDRFDIERVSTVSLGTE